tara:strand:- start:357 stop:1718 length:1362 start_codon:yes stop_codon:yes gene_type:complete
MANTRLYKVYSGSSGTNAQKKWTVSVWVKKQKTGASQTIAGGYRSSNNFYCDLLKFNANGNLKFFSNSDAGNADTFFQTNARYNDVNGWYHIVQNVDTTQSTQSERFKMWVNGEQITSWSSSTYPVQNDSLYWGMPNDVEHQIGAINSGEYWDGLMSHFYFIQNETHAPTVFGQTDATTGEWSIKTNVTGVNYIGRSFYIFKDNNSHTDQSGNNNTWSLSGNLTKTEDNPSNVFATWNPLDGNLGNSTFSYSNNKFNSEDGANKCWARSTLGMTSGKYYFEMKVQTPSNNCAIGISDRPSPNLTTELGAGAYDYSYQSANSGNKYNNGSQSSYGNTYTTNDIVSCALDLDNLKVYFGKNGTWQNSGDPTSGSTGTGAAFTVAAPSSTDGGAYFFCGGDLTGSNNVRLLANFGNGIFADNDPVASAGTNASNNGIFEYDVPTGYTALSTKGLNL